MRYLVTGGAGFIGSNFIRHLLAERADAEVVNLDKLTYAGNPDNLKDLDPKRHWLVQADVCSQAAVNAAMAGADVVVHFAAETHVDRSLLDATGFVRTDVEGTYVLLEAARTYRVQKFVHISTDEVYGSRAEGEFREDDVTNPRNPYSASKLGGERMAYAYHQTYDVPVEIVRPSNNYGPYQYPEKLVPLFTTNGLLGMKLPLYGDGLHRRDWLFVEDCARAVLLLADKGGAGEVYNVPGGNERPNRDVADRIIAQLGLAADVLEPVADRTGHDRRYAIAGDKIAALGFKPQTSFEDGLKRTVDWYRDNEWWWRKLRRDPAYLRYYKRQYDERQAAGAGGEDPAK